MRLDSIIDDIRNERKQNAQNINTENLFKLKTTLNDKKSPKKQISFSTSLSARDALDDLLLQITKKYDLVNTSSSNSKQIVPRKKPPPPPGLFPRFAHKRSSSIYIPPKKAWDIPLPPPPPELKKNLKL